MQGFNIGLEDLIKLDTKRKSNGLGIKLRLPKPGGTRGIKIKAQNVYAPKPDQIILTKEKSLEFTLKQHQTPKVESVQKLGEHSIFLNYRELEKMKQDQGSDSSRIELSHSYNLPEERSRSLNELKEIIKNDHFIHKMNDSEEIFNKKKS